jgi:hypothetical protein
MTFSVLQDNLGLLKKLWEGSLNIWKINETILESLRITVGKGQVCYKDIFKRLSNNSFFHQKSLPRLLIHNLKQTAANLSIYSPFKSPSMPQQCQWHRYVSSIKFGVKCVMESAESLFDNAESTLQTSKDSCFLEDRMKPNPTLGKLYYHQRTLRSSILVV